MAVKKKIVRPPRPVPPPRRRPILVFTLNGKVIGRVVAPPGANDVRLFFNFGFGWWTRNRAFMPNGGFLFPPQTNDFHFSLTGQSKPGARPLIPPPGANDLEIIWDEKEQKVIEAWWTQNGDRMDRIPLAQNQSDFDCALNPEQMPRTTG